MVSSSTFATVAVALSAIAAASARSVTVEAMDLTVEQNEVRIIRRLLSFGLSFSLSLSLTHTRCAVAYLAVQALHTALCFWAHAPAWARRA